MYLYKEKYTHMCMVSFIFYSFELTANVFPQFPKIPLPVKNHLEYQKNDDNNAVPPSQTVATVFL